MGQKVLFTASTYSHILHFHRPYLRLFREKGWEVHAACGGAPAAIPEADEVIHLPLEKKMTAPAETGPPQGACAGKYGRERLCASYLAHLPGRLFPHPDGGEGDEGAAQGDQYGARLSLR